MNGKVRHDLKCSNCNSVFRDCYIERNSIVDGGTQDMCSNCEHVGLSIYFGNWTDIQVFNDGLGCMYGYLRAEMNCRVREFCVADDSLSQIQLGMFTRPTDKGLKNFTEEQTMTYREKLLTEGDSGKLRREIHETYESNKAKGL